MGHVDGPPLAKMTWLMSEAAPGLCAGGASVRLTSSPEESGEESEYRLESSDAAAASCALSGLA